MLPLIANHDLPQFEKKILAFVVHHGIGVAWMRGSSSTTDWTHVSSSASISSPRHHRDSPQQGSRWQELPKQLWEPPDGDRGTPGLSLQVADAMQSVEGLWFGCHIHHSPKKKAHLERENYQAIWTRRSHVFFLRYSRICSDSMCVPFVYPYVFHWFPTWPRDQKLCDSH